MWWLIPRYDLTGKTAKLNPEPTSKNKYKKYQDNWSIFYEYKKTTLLIDADVLAFEASVVAEESIEWKDETVDCTR